MNFVTYLCRRLNPESTLTRVPDFDGTTATFTGMLSAPVRNVIPVARTSAVPAGVMFGPMPNSAPSLRPHAHHPAQAGKHDALLEPADQRDPFGHHRHAAVPGVELLLELPAELRDVRADLDVALLELLDDAVGQQGQAEAGARQVGRLGNREAERLAERRRAEQRSEERSHAPRGERLIRVSTPRCVKSASLPPEDGPHSRGMRGVSVASSAAIVAQPSKDVLSGSAEKS